MTINLSERYLIIASLHRGYVLGVPLGFLLLSIGPRKSSIIRNGGHAFVWSPGRCREECPLISLNFIFLFFSQQISHGPLPLVAVENTVISRVLALMTC